MVQSFAVGFSLVSVFFFQSSKLDLQTLIVPSAGAVLCRNFLWCLHTMSLVSAAFVVVVLVVIMVLGDLVGTGSASLSSWTCSLKSVLLLQWRSVTVRGSYDSKKYTWGQIFLKSLLAWPIYSVLALLQTLSHHHSFGHSAITHADQHFSLSDLAYVCK